MNGPAWIRCPGTGEVGVFPFGWSRRRWGAFPPVDRAFCAVCGRPTYRNRAGIVGQHKFMRGDQPEPVWPAKSLPYITVAPPDALTAVAS